jgi:carboxyl-terminal processing protease
LIQQLKAAGIQGLVLDLRHNGGGFLGEAINLAGLFIPAGPVVQVRESDGKRTVDSSDSTEVAYDGPLAVLTDRFSASASEIVAGALQNYGRAIVVGDKSTHGKGTVQTVVEMKSISRELANSDAKTGAAKITIQKFYLPSGSSTQLRGVVPDISLPSIDDYLPIGESSLPHALIWDSISSTPFDGKPIDPQLLSVLMRASEGRQNKLDEFAYLRRSVDWFRARQEQKLVSLNLMERRRQKESDDAFLKESKAEKSALAKVDYAHKEIWLGPPPPPKPKPTKDDGADDDDDENATLSTDDTAPYPSMDVPLRETFRILDDAIDLGRKHQYWAADHPPLTIASKG